MPIREYPKSLRELESRFSNQKTCLEYLKQLRWPNGVECLRCRGKRVWKTKRKLFHCANCGFQFSVTSRTIFHGTRKPLRVWFRMIWQITEEMPSRSLTASEFKRSLKLGCYETAWQWFHKLRYVMASLNREPLSGIVEVGYAFLTNVDAPHLKHLGRIGVVEGIRIGVAVEPEAHRVRIGIIPDTNLATLTKFMMNNVCLGSVIQIQNGQWILFRKVFSANRGWTIEQKREPITNVLFVVEQLQRWLSGIHRGAVKPSHLGLYLDHLSMRLSHFKSGTPGNLFHKVLQEALNLDPIIGEDLKA